MTADLSDQWVTGKTLHLRLEPNTSKKSSFGDVMPIPDLRGVISPPPKVTKRWLPVMLRMLIQQVR